MEINRLSQLRARAYENMLAIATCSYPDSVSDCTGGSGVFDGVAYLPELDGSRDTCILQTDGTEGICSNGMIFLLGGSGSGEPPPGRAFSINPPILSAAACRIRAVTWAQVSSVNPAL